jgi:hypothetical protein
MDTKRLHLAEPIERRGVVATILFEPLGAPALTTSAFTIADALLVDQHGRPLRVEWEGNMIRQIFRVHLPLLAQ